MVRIEVVSNAVEDRMVPNKASPDRPWHFREQSAYAFVMDADGHAPKYPISILVSLEKDQAPYQPGMYLLDPRSIYVGEFRKLEIGRLRLIPESAGARKAA